MGRHARRRLWERYRITLSDDQAERLVGLLTACSRGGDTRAARLVERQGRDKAVWEVDLAGVIGKRVRAVVVFDAREAFVVTVLGKGAWG